MDNAASKLDAVEKCPQHLNFTDDAANHIERRKSCRYAGNDRSNSFGDANEILNVLNKKADSITNTFNDSWQRRRKVISEFLNSRQCFIHLYYKLVHDRSQGIS